MAGLGQTDETAVVDTVARYFFFISLDQNLSFSASRKVLADLKSRNHLGVEHRASWVKALHHWRRKIRRLKAKAWAPEGMEKSFLLPAKFELEVWASFLESSAPDEIEAVLLSRVLEIPDQDIASGLGVSEGTVRYRVGRGLRQLGGFCEF